MSPPPPGPSSARQWGWGGGACLRRAGCGQWSRWSLIDGQPVPTRESSPYSPPCRRAGWAEGAEHPEIAARWRSSEQAWGGSAAPGCQRPPPSRLHFLPQPPPPRRPGNPAVRGPGRSALASACGVSRWAIRARLGRGRPGARQWLIRAGKPEGGGSLVLQPRARVFKGLQPPPGRPDPSSRPVRVRAPGQGGGGRTGSCCC